MRVATVDGLVTLFYDGSKEPFNPDLDQEWTNAYYNNFENKDNWEEWNLSDECKRYWKERQSWQQIIIEDGETDIPKQTFQRCKNIQRVVMANTIVRIGEHAFDGCKCLAFIKWSINLEVIENGAFMVCDLISVFIPPRCREIRMAAFRDNYKLTLFHVPQNVQLGPFLLSSTKLMRDSHFELDECGNCNNHTDEENNWIKNINTDEKYSLHRACSSYQPLQEIIDAIIRQQGLRSFAIKNEMGITPSRYLKENPYADIQEMDIIRDYILKMMGEGE
ncbi:hypothetical protein CTEN210_02867 [Chaetoceros tenuissimus]|uniref:Uncharacterized protein n=1 Tax=Chaetoceros tenuissimus TaxID=426638 RepID=A0AAD3CIR7_9STRA|nr:hypothetical protein CTEN210_02867 [Chaetoceros tenuissimus]